MGRQCYALIDAMFIETMWRHLVERRHELTWSHRHTCTRGRHPISMRGKWRLMCILDFFNMKTLLQLLLAHKWKSSKNVLFKNNLLQSDTVPLKELNSKYTLSHLKDCLQTCKIVETSECLHFDVIKYTYSTSDLLQNNVIKFPNNIYILAIQ